MSKIKFGTGGFRGILGDDFTKENVQIIIQALCNIAKAERKTDKPIVVGYDKRFMSDYFARWVCGVLAANSIQALLYKMPVPTPAVMCATKNLGNDYGIMITASHNPYIFNGIKLFLQSGVDADAEFTDRLDKDISNITEVKSMSLRDAKAQGLVREFFYIDEYLANIKAFILDDIKKNNAKVLFDNMCGVGIVGLERLSRDFCIKRFDILNSNHDAFFNFKHPNPIESALGHLKDKVVSEGYDYAVATDSDGDRLGVIDDLGNYVSNNDILGALYFYLVRHRGMKGDIVKNYATSVLLDKLAKRLGFKCHEVDVGFKNISSKMLKTDALIGGESSGGLTIRNYIFGKDSIFSASLFMEMQAVMNRPISEIIASVREFAGYDMCFIEDSVRCEDEKPITKLFEGYNPFSKRLRTYEVMSNNVKYHFDGESWVLLRLSGTEPVVRIFAETPSNEESLELVGIIKNILKVADA